MEPNEQAAVQQEIGTLRQDIEHLKGEVIECEKLLKKEKDAHAITKDKLDRIKEIL